MAGTLNGSDLRGIDVPRLLELANEINVALDSEFMPFVQHLRKINEELDMAWEGQAQVAFEATWGDWVNRINTETTDVLTQVTQYIRQIVEAYQDLDAQAAQAAAQAGQH